MRTIQIALVGSALALLLCGLAAVEPATASEGGNWEKLYVKQGITGYRRYTPNTNFAAWRGTGMIDANFYRVVAVYMDSDRSCEWLADCVENRYLEKPDLDHQTTYNHTHLPWPFSDRDLVFTDHFVFNPATRSVFDRMHSVKDPKAPERPGLVRAVLLESSFTAHYVDASHTFVEVTLQLDTGGWLPAWLVNLTSKDWPYQTFVRLRQACATAKGFDALEAKIRAAHPFAPSASKLGASQPAASKPAASQPAASKLTASKQATSKPAANQPATSKLTASKQAASKPAASAPTAAASVAGK